jgi:4-hydroxybenzoate polyprenyltransferase
VVKTVNTIVEYAKLLRFPGLGGLAIPPVFGALSVGMYDLGSLIILFVIGALTAIYGFVLNDYADVQLDSLISELKNKPLVKGVIARKNAVAVCIFSLILTFFFTFLLWKGETLSNYRFAALGCLVIAGILGSIYNLYGKKIIASDLLVSASISLVFLFGALSFSDDIGVLSWVIFFLTFNQTLHMNAVQGGLKDADHDYLMGVNNIALRLGVKVENNHIFVPSLFKAFGMGIRLFSVFLVFIPFLFGMDYYLWQIVLLVAFLSGIFLFEIKLLYRSVFNRVEIRKLIAGSSFLRYMVVPVILIVPIGIIRGIILVFLPIIWYIVFTPLLGSRLFQPEM